MLLKVRNGQKKNEANKKQKSKNEVKEQLLRLLVEGKKYQLVEPATQKLLRSMLKSIY